MTLPLLLQIQPKAYYTEFHPDALITQPWNTWSSLVFLLPAFYWGYQLRGNYQRYWVWIAVLPLSLLNGIGSTLWHAYSGGSIYLKLDIYPPRIMMAFLAIYFCRLLSGKWLLGILSFAALAWLVLQYKDTFRPMIPVGWVTFNYIFNSLIVIVPAIAVLIKYKGNGIKPFLLTLVCLLLAVWFRVLDAQRPIPEVIPQGTHFLWHIFCAAAYLPLGVFIIRLMDQSKKQR